MSFVFSRRHFCALLTWTRSSPKHPVVPHYTPHPHSHPSPLPITLALSSTAALIAFSFYLKDFSISQANGLCMMYICESELQIDNLAAGEVARAAEHWEPRLAGAWLAPDTFWETSVYYCSGFSFVVSHPEMVFWM